MAGEGEGEGVGSATFITWNLETRRGCSPAATLLLPDTGGSMLTEPASAVADGEAAAADVATGAFCGVAAGAFGVAGTVSDAVGTVAAATGEAGAGAAAAGEATAACAVAEIATFMGCSGARSQAAQAPGKSWPHTRYK